jgi:hypothetical protein
MDLLERLARHLIINSSFIPDIGLYHGKMGIVLFFAHYARFTGSPLYDEFAGELLDEICQQINLDTPVHFESGLCGIGWSILYLLENKFIKGDANEILSEIDEKIMETDVRRINDLSERTGLAGILLYINKRIHFSQTKQPHGIFDELYIKDIESANNRLGQLPANPLYDLIDAKYPENDNITDWLLGLECGCAGLGLKKVLK